MGYVGCCDAVKSIKKNTRERHALHQLLTDQLASFSSIKEKREEMPMVHTPFFVGHMLSKKRKGNRNRN